MPVSFHSLLFCNNEPEDITILYLLLRDGDNILVPISLTVCTFLCLCLYTLKVREFQQLSQGSRSSNISLLGGRNLAVTALAEDVGGGNVQVGKITFNTHEILGNGCEGTFVFK